VKAHLLAWYVAGLFGLTALLLSLVTAVPGAEVRLWAVQAAAGAAGLACAGAGCLLARLPPEHWSNRSPLARGLWAVLAVGVTLLVVLGAVM